MKQKQLNEENQIVEAIKSYIKEEGGEYNAWSVGICQDMPDIVPLLYSARCKQWMYYKISAPRVAKEVLDLCVNNLGMKARHGLQHHGDSSCIIFVYKRLDINIS
jgi:hypothetical protein